MAITFRNTTTVANALVGGTAVALSTPAGTVNGDVMIAHICIGATGRTITPPAGWTELIITVNESGHTHRVYTHTAAGEAASRSWTISGAAAAFAGILSSYGGVANVHGNSNADGLALLAHPGPTVQSYSDGAWLEVSSSVTSILALGWTAPAGMTERADVIGGIPILLNVTSCVDTAGPVGGLSNFQRSTTSVDLVQTLNVMLILEPVQTVTASTQTLRYVNPTGLFTSMGIVSGSSMGAGASGDGYVSPGSGAMIFNTLQAFQVSPGGSCC